MSKNKITLVALKEIMNDSSKPMFVSENSFRSSIVGKALKRNCIEHSAITYLYENTDNWFVKEYCLEKSGLTYKEAAKCGLVDAVQEECEWGEFFSGITGFFESAEEFVTFTKEEYGIDLTSDDLVIDHTIDHQHFINFAEGITRNCGGRYLLSKKRCEFAEKVKQVYLDSFASIIRLNQYKIAFCKNKNTVTVKESLLEISENLWAVDIEALMKLVYKNIPADEGNLSRLQVLMSVAYVGFIGASSKLFPFKGEDDFIENLLFEIKTLNPNFPYAPIKLLNVHMRNVFENFTNSFYNYISGYNTSVRFTPEQKCYLNDHFIADLINDVSALERIGKACDMGPFSRACLNVTPLESLDVVFDRLVIAFDKRQTLDSMDVVISDNDSFYVTQHIADVMLTQGNRSWQTMAFPKERLYDMNYIRSVVGILGKKGLMFGSDLRNNRYFVNRIDLDKMPDEFFTEFEEYIDWRNVSSCLHSSLAFLKQHKEKLIFYYIPRKVSNLIDDELGLFLINKDTMSDYGIQALGHSTNLSIDFIIKHIDVLCYRSEKRHLTASALKLTLSEIVSGLE